MISIRFFCIAAIVASLFLELTLFPFPLVFIFSLLLYILYPRSTSVIIGFCAGLILDAVKVDAMGITPFAIVAASMIVELFNKALELKDYKFIILFLFLASYIFALIFGYNRNILLYAGVFVSIAFGISYLFKRRILW